MAMTWRPKGRGRFGRRGWIAWSWILTCLVTGWLMVTIRLYESPWNSIEPMMALLLHGAVFGLGLSAWGAGRIGKDSQDRRSVIIGAIEFPVSRIKPALAWSVLYLTLLASWVFLIGHASPWLYVIPVGFMAACFGCIVSSFMEEQRAQARQVYEQKNPR